MIVLQEAVMSTDGIRSAMFQMVLGRGLTVIIEDAGSVIPSPSDMTHNTLAFHINWVLAQTVENLRFNFDGFLLQVVFPSTPLPPDTWMAGFIERAATPIWWYLIDVTSGTTYHVWWNDASHGDSTKTAHIVVRAYYNDDRTPIFADTSSGWTTPRTFTATRTGLVRIRVAPANDTFVDGTFGTFGIAYTTANTRPPVTQ